MILAISEVLALLAFVVGALTAALNYFGGSTLYLVLQLWWQGARDFQKLVSPGIAHGSVM